MPLPSSPHWAPTRTIAGTSHLFSSRAAGPEQGPEKGRRRRPYGGRMPRLLPAALPDVEVDGRALRGAELRAAAEALAVRVDRRAAVAAVDATASLETVVAVVGCLLAGVPVVPVPPDSGPRERAHLLRDSGAAVWLGSARSDVGARDAAGRRRGPGRRSRAGRARRRHGADHVHLGHDRGAEGRGALAVARSPPAWTGCSTRGPGRRTTCWCTGCRCSTSTGWSSACSARCAPGSRLVHTGRPTPAAYAAAGAARCTSACRRCGDAWRPTRGGARAASGPVAGLGQRGLAGAGVPLARRPGRSGPGRALRHDRNADHRRGAGRRRAAAGLGRRAAARRRDPGRGRRRRSRRRPARSGTCTCAGRR